MIDWLAARYDLLRGLHILAVVAWMAGLLYLPRLFAYHARALAKPSPNAEMVATFQTMEAKLLRIIMNPAMAAVWLFGAGLILADAGIRGWSFVHEPWMIVKLAGVVLVTGWHVYLSLARKALLRGESRHSERFWRMTNELPFLAAIAMVIAVTTEFGR